MLNLRTFRILIFASVVCAVPIHAQNLRQWMPNVGNTFVYDSTYSYDGQNGSQSRPYSGSGRDTVTMEIVAIDSPFANDTTWRVVTTKTSYSSGIPSSVELFYFHAGRDSISTNSLMITPLDPRIIPPATFLDFSDSRASQIDFGSKQITMYRFDSAEVASFGYDSLAAEYSPDLHWLVYQYYHSYVNNYPFLGQWSNDFSTETLLSADLSRVDESASNTSDFSIEYAGMLLQILLNEPKSSVISLLDPLSHQVRSWQMPIGTGPREISLNVADVPNGIYFLRVSGTGVGEVKKVMIAH